MGFSREELESFRGARVPDLVRPDCRLLFVGINPGLWTAATQTHFCHPSNRFYPALNKAGLIDFEVDTNAGMTDQQRDSFVEKGLGISNLVERATVRASELDAGELRSGGERLLGLVEGTKPKVVAVLGITAFRTAFSDRSAVVGQQDVPGSSEWWALPNPSGLNAHITSDGLSEWFADMAHRAGVN